MKRVRTGCLNCRKRHKKCDEGRPTCSLCLSKNEKCQWPLVNGRFHKNSFSEFSTSNGVAKTPQEKLSPLREVRNNNLEVYLDRLLKSFEKMTKVAEKPSKPPLEVSWSADTAAELIGSSVDSYGQQDLQGKGSSTLSPLSDILPNIPALGSPDAVFSFQENNVDSETTQKKQPALTHILNSDNSDEEGKISQVTKESVMAPFMLYSELHSTLRDYMFTSATSVADLDDSATFNNMLTSPMPNFLRSENSSKSLNEQLMNEGLQAQLLWEDIQLSSEQKLELFKNYLYEVAPWLDMFDISRQFGVHIPQLATSSEPLLQALYTLSSRQKELTDPTYPREITLKLYQESLKQLIPTVNKTMDRAIISGCVLLCVLEMMSSSPNEWRHHLEGCAALFKSNNIHGFSNGLERGLFWCYARMDVSAAVIGKQATIINSENWLPREITLSELKEYFLSHNTADMYSNYMVFLCSRIMNLISQEIASYDGTWEQIWNEVIEWHAERPDELKPFAEYESTPFPGVLYLKGPAISANQLYHMAIILLTENKPRLYKIRASEHVVCISCLLKRFTNFRNQLYGMQSRYVPSVCTTLISM